MKDFEPTGLRVTWVGPKGPKVAEVCYADERAVEWDGAAIGTNGAVLLPGKGHAYVELVITGRTPREHGGLGYGTKARLRFTGEHDTREWIDAVVLV